MGRRAPPTEIDVDETAKELAALEGAYEEAARALAAAHGRIRERYWPEEEQLSLRAATRFIAGRLELEEAAKAVRTSEADAHLVLSDAVTKGVELGLRSAEKELTQRIHRRKA